MESSSKNKIFGFIGPSGSGKTTLAKHLVKKLDFLYIPSITTREKRNKDKGEYKHISIKEFEDHIKKKEILEYTVFAGNYYGKLKKDIKNNLDVNHSVYTLTPDQVENLKKEHKETKIILVIPERPILKTVKKRLEKRGHNKEEVIERLREVEKELAIINDLKDKKLIDKVIYTLEDDYFHALNKVHRFAKKHL
ncbi:guanylate kinase [bacterium]|nr:guanylate kinase [bacterium]